MGGGHPPGCTAPDLEPAMTHADQTPLPHHRISRRVFARVLAAGGAAAAVPVLSARGAEAATGSWNLAGNTGISPTTNYLGTNDAQPLVLKTNKSDRIHVLGSGQVGISTTTPAAQLHVRRVNGDVLKAEYAGSSNGVALRATTASAAGAIAVLGDVTSTSAAAGSSGVLGRSKGQGDGVVGSGHRGVVGSSADVGGTGVAGSTAAGGASTVAVNATATGATSNALKATVSGGGVSYAVWGIADSASYAGIFQGRVNVYGDLYTSGTLSKAAGTFKIDHPLDPAGSYLYHSFVESPDMLNVYSGIVRVGADGSATVELPGYFDALNTDVRYQLTAVGAAMPDLHVAVPYAEGSFGIGGAAPGEQVSWQVTGVRQDAYAKAHAVVVEVPKPAAERGTFLHPEALGRPAATRLASPRS